MQPMNDDQIRAHAAAINTILLDFRQFMAEAVHCGATVVKIPNGKGLLLGLEVAGMKFLTALHYDERPGSPWQDYQATLVPPA